MTQALLIFKPDSSHRRAVRAGVWNFIERRGDIELKGLTWFEAPADLVEAHYDFLRGRPFFPWLVDFMTALPVIVGRIEASPEALDRMRYDLGETRIHEARPGSVRETYGIYGGINCLHLSDSPESGEREVALWASRVDLDRVACVPSEGADGPDHTFHLRSLAGQVAHGVHRDLAIARITELLAEESGESGERLDTLVRIIVGAL